MTEVRQPQRGPTCPPAFALESFAAGEAPGAEVMEHLPGCASCRGYLETLRAAQAEFLAQRPPEMFLRQVARCAAQTPRRPWAPRLHLWAMGLPALALIAIVPLLLLRSGSEVRTKGGAFTVVYKRPGMAEPARVTPDLELRAGDALRFAYAAPRDGYLMILDRDGSGKVTAFHPFQGREAQPIAAGAPALLPHSVTLDDAPGPEWLVAVFSAAPLMVEPLARQLAEQVPGTPIELRCGDCRVEVLRVKKSHGP